MAGRWRWSTTSGSVGRSVPDGKVISECFRTLSTVDQLSLPNLVGIELLARPRALIHEARRFSPHSLGFSSAAHFWG